MKQCGLSQRQHQVLSNLSVLPKKILALHGKEHMSEFVLHELCKKQCFDMVKAAYFVDNPDFDCLQGIAGYSQDDHSMNSQEFSDHLSGCHFNKKVQSISRPSYQRLKKTASDIINEIALDLNIENPQLYIWQLKHENQGVLIYEMSGDQVEELNDCIHNGLYLLGFCAIN